MDDIQKSTGETWVRRSQVRQIWRQKGEGLNSAEGGTGPHINVHTAKEISNQARNEETITLKGEANRVEFLSQKFCCIQFHTKVLFDSHSGAK